MYVKNPTSVMALSPMTKDDAESADERTFREKQRRFYALVGHCILRFQHVEDYLEDVFAAILGGGRDRADAIFASVRGIDRKIQTIKASATGLSGKPWNGLDSLLAKVRQLRAFVVRLLTPILSKAVGSTSRFEPTKGGSSKPRASK
jgi:hypothetical protein